MRGSARLKLKAIAHRERYAWISSTLAKFKYWLLRKKDKSIVKGYLLRLSETSGPRNGVSREGSRHEAGARPTTA